MATTPTADISGFTDEQKRLYQQAASLGSGVAVTNNGATQTVSSANPYTPESMTSTETPVKVPPYAEPAVPDTTSLADIMAKYQEQNTAQSTATTQKNDLLTNLKGLFEKQGSESARKAELETAAGIPDLNKTANELIQQIRQNNLGAFSASQGQEDRLAPTFAISGAQAQIERQRAVKNYGLGVAVEAVNGNIALAQQNIERALAAEFDPLESQIKYQQLLLDDVKDTLTREDAKKAQSLQIALDERARILEQQKADKTEIYNVIKLAGQYGADPATLQKIQGAKTPGEALTLASKYLQDPKAQYELESARLDNIMKKEQIATEQRQRALLGQPTAAEAKAEREALANSKTAIPLLEDKVAGIDALINHPGMDTVVGPNLLARADFLLLDSDITGASQQFVGAVHKLVAGETLQYLLDLKRAGGTLGALNAQELDILKGAATLINDREIKNDKGVGVGKWNMTEGDMNKELETIKKYANLALQRARGTMLSADESLTLDSIYDKPGATLPGLSFYPQ